MLVFATLLFGGLNEAREGGGEKGGNEAVFPVSLLLGLSQFTGHFSQLPVGFSWSSDQAGCGDCSSNLG